MITRNGTLQNGLILIDGVPAGSGGGGGGIPDAPSDGKMYARQSEAWAEANSSAITSVLFGDVETGLEQLDTSIGTLSSDIAALQPTVLLDTSAAFAANTFQTIWSKTLPAGLTGTFELSNGLISTGTAATASVVQARLFTCYRRVTGGVAAVPVGSAGIQTQGIAGAQIRLTVSGNDILLQLSFTNAGTYFYNFPIYLNERQI